MAFALFGVPLFIIAFVYWYVTRPYALFPTYWFISSMLWKYLNGTISRNALSTADYIQEYIKASERFRSEGLFVTWLPHPHLNVFTEKAAKAFLNDPACTDKSAIFDVSVEVFGEGLLNSKGDIWKKHRKMLNPVFHTDKLKGRIFTFNEWADVLVKELSEVSDKSCVDIYEHLTLNSLRVVFDSFLGVKMKNDYNKEALRIMRNVPKILETVAYRMVNPLWRSKFIFSLTSDGKKFMKMCEDMNNFTRKVILEIKESIVSNQSVEEQSTDHVEYRKSFVHILLDCMRKDPSFTLQNLEDQIKTFIITGYDTASISMTWCLYMLGLHPDIQDQVYNEVVNVTDEFVTFEQLCELKYLERVIMETLRLYPTVPIIARDLKKDMQFEKYGIPKGTPMTFFLYAIHRDPEIYPDPEKFDPDRFEGSFGKRPYAHLPFSEGIRNCIGKRFAMMEIKVMLAHVIRNFKVTSLKKREDIKLRWQISMMATEPILLHITPRNKVH